MIAAVIVTDLSPARTRELAVPRLLGTLVGAGIGAVAAITLGTAAWAMGVAMLVTIFGVHAFGLREAAKLTGYVCGIVVLEHAAEPWAYALARLTETVIGVAVAVLVSMVPKWMAAERSHGHSA
jgi:uncharacterized membrane protein YgaE (UPF0421/DUF939 family)